MASYADDNSPYTMQVNKENIIASLNDDDIVFLQWLNNKYFRMNIEKCHLLIANYDNELVAEIAGEKKCCESLVKLLGITIDNSLNFKEHIDILYKKASLKLHALARIAYFISMNKKILPLTLDVS